MQTIDIRQVGDDLILYFGCQGTRINAYTLASALVSFADAAKAANNQINPGYDVEIVVEALGNGSFKAQIRAIYRSARNLFSRNSVKSIILGIVTALIYDHTIAPNHDMKVQINDDSVVIVQGEKQIIVPRNVYEATNDLKRDPEVKRSVSEFFRSIDQDESVQSFGVTTKMDAPPPELQVQRENIHEAAVAADLPEPNSRLVPEQAEVQILRAILERSKRRWEFSWRGIRISAPVTDAHFYQEFFAHRIKIAPGDTLDVMLLIRQTRDPDTGVFTNVDYEVSEVLKHTPRITQPELLQDDVKMPREDK
jgi:hypothetical protein